MRVRYCALGFALFCSTVLAQYRCVENGRTILTDRPCAGDKPATSQPQPNQIGEPTVHGDAANSAYGSPSGSWRGQVQYQGTSSGGVVQEAMTVVPMVIDIDPRGQVKGSSPENGCVLKGIAAPGFAPTLLNLDITLTGCQYKGLNRRFSGSILVNQAQKYAQFSLSGSNVAPMGKLTLFDIKGTLRR